MLRITYKIKTIVNIVMKGKVHLVIKKTYVIIPINCFDPNAFIMFIKTSLHKVHNAAISGISVIQMLKYGQFISLKYI